MLYTVFNCRLESEKLKKKLSKKEIKQGYAVRKISDLGWTLKELKKLSAKAYKSKRVKN